MPRHVWPILLSPISSPSHKVGVGPLPWSFLIPGIASIVTPPNFLSLVTSWQLPLELWRLKTFYLFLTLSRDKLVTWSMVNSQKSSASWQKGCHVGQYDEEWAGILYITYLPSLTRLKRYLLDYYNVFICFLGPPVFYSLTIYLCFCFSHFADRALLVGLVSDWLPPTYASWVAGVVCHHRSLYSFFIAINPLEQWAVKLPGCHYSCLSVKAHIRMKSRWMEQSWNMG
jgi:hypothetical protein